MVDFVYMIAEFYNDIFNDVLMNITIYHGTTPTSFGAILIVGAIIGFVITVFWKGAHK